MLAVSDLDDLVAALRHQGAGVVEHLQPGLDRAAIDAVAASLGVTFPEELRTWWGYADGPAARRPNALTCLGWWAPLQECVAECVENRSIQAEAAADDVLPVWTARHFPLVVGSQWFAVDVSGPDVAPVLAVDWDDVPDPDALALYGSVGELVRAWIRALDEGALTWSAEEGLFDLDEERLDALGIPGWVI